MKTVTVYGSGSSGRFRVDHVTLDRDNEAIDDDTWNTLCAILTRYDVEKKVDDVISSDRKGFAYTFPITL